MTGDEYVRMGGRHDHPTWWSAAGVRPGTSPTPARRPTWPALPLDGDPLRDTAIRTAGGLLALTTYHLRTP